MQVFKPDSGGQEGGGRGKGEKGAALSPSTRTDLQPFQPGLHAHLEQPPLGYTSAKCFADPFPGQGQPLQTQGTAG